MRGSFLAFGGPPRRHGRTQLEKRVSLDPGRGPGTDFEQILARTKGHSYQRSLLRGGDQGNIFGLDRTPTDLPEERRPQIMNDGRIRVGLLLPFEAGNEAVNEVATDLFNAAQLAVFDINRPEITLIVKPTNGTKKGAVKAVRAALNEGAQIKDRRPDKLDTQDCTCKA